MENLSRARVAAALSFRQPDILPLYDNYWEEFVENWMAVRGKIPPAVSSDTTDTGRDSPAAAPPNPKDAAREAIHDYYGNDIVTAAADETPWPSLKARLEERPEEGAVISRGGWGETVRTVEGAHFSQELGVALEERVDPDKLSFESPLLESRYAHSDALIARRKGRYALFAKTGGPFKRPSMLRGYTGFLMDMAEDPGWVRALVERVMDHLIAVGVEQLRRNREHLAGIQINDDSCSLQGPVMGPRAYERLCLPSLKRMVKAYKEAGAACVYMHCDGNAMPLVEMWIDAGLDAMHPCELRAGVDVFALRQKHGRKLAFMGAMDNCHILPQGSQEEITTHIRRLAELGRDGGLILGGHSIGPDISVEHYEWAMAARARYGRYASAKPVA